MYVAHSCFLLLLSIVPEGKLPVQRRKCPRHPSDYPCTCAMGNLYRFVEPVLLFLLKKKGSAYGYELAGDLRGYAFTDADIEAAALYRTLRQLEKNGCVKSKWDVQGGGPARRVYALTEWGDEHLQEWVTVLDHMSGAMRRFIKEVRQSGGSEGRILKPGRSSKSAKTFPNTEGQ